MVLTVSRPGDVDAFLAEAGAFLAAREAEHNLLFGISSGIRRNPTLFGEQPPSFAVVRDDERVVLASLRTPPFNQVISQVDDPSAVALLIDALAGEDVPGVVAPKGIAESFASGWAKRAGVSSRLEVAERIFRLERVRMPDRPAAGSWRLVETRDRELLAEWLLAFLAEAVPDQPSPPDALAAADRWIAAEGRTGYVWQVDGQVTSFVGASGETPSGIRIGPVYTPPDQRGRGYASWLTASASRDQLGRGRRYCFLFTDLANPTSNKIYRSIGYEPVCDMDMYHFDPAG